MWVESSNLHFLIIANKRTLKCGDRPGVGYTNNMQRRRRITGILFIAAAIVVILFQNQAAYVQPVSLDPRPTTPSEATQVSIDATTEASTTSRGLAIEILDTLNVKGRAPKTGYERTLFGDGWLLTGGCDMRNVILHRDLSSTSISDDCKVMSGILADPYTGTTISFTRGKDTSDLVQIDHVVALSNAWQTGAQQLTLEQRVAFANDPLELLAVDGSANQAKGDGDAATWLPANKAFRCQYVARQIAVKAKYSLWVTEAEKSAMRRVLADCSEQALPTASP